MSVSQVSRLAGFSTATVSRVVNNDPAVTRSTADTVRRAMRQINYTGKRYRRHSKSQVVQECKPIALLFPDPCALAMKTALSGRLCHGISQALKRAGQDFVICSLSNWDRLPACIANNAVSGVIVRGNAPVETLLSMIDPIQCVTVFETLCRPSIGDQVLEDNAMIGEVAFRYLADRGARQLACVSRDPLHPAHAARMDSFMRAARFAGIEAAAISAAVPYPELATSLQMLKPSIDGLFVAGNDTDLAGIYAGLVAAGRRVGSDLKLIATAYDPARVDALDHELDHIDIQPEDIGFVATELLLWRLSGANATPQRRLISPRLVSEGTGK